MSVAAFCVLALLPINAASAADSGPQQWAQAEIRDGLSKRIHHWGLKGQSLPHNGWARYGHMTLDLGGAFYYVYDQGRGEFSAAVIDRQSGTVKLRAIDIPGAGFFYFPSEAAPCEPDAIERLGLYGERVLYYLSSAFPAGPARVEGSSMAVVDAAVPELRFMQGVMKSTDRVRTEVRASSTGPGKLQYSFHDDRDDIKGLWESDGDLPVVPDGETLSDWRACWSGVWSRSAQGVMSFESNLRQPQKLKTFGDIRGELRQAGAAVPTAGTAPNGSPATGRP